MVFSCRIEIRQFLPAAIRCVCTAAAKGTAFTDPQKVGYNTGDGMKIFRVACHPWNG